MSVVERRGRPRKHANAAARQAAWRKKYPERARASRNAWRARNGDRVRDYVRKRKDQVDAFLHKIKLRRGCKDCGYKKHHAALDFDHVRGQKRFAISAARDRHASIEDIHAEIKKCDVRCANCHRIQTFDRRRK